MKVRIEQDIVIPAGLVMDDAPRVTRRYGPWCEALTGFGKAHTGRFTLDFDVVRTFPEQFTILEE